MLKKYKLTNLANPFLRNDGFGFKVRYEKIMQDGKKRIVDLENAPVFLVAKKDVLATTNEFAQQMLAGMIVPQNTTRNGQKFTSGKLFEDVTAVDPQTTIDMDVEFNK